MMRKMSVCPLLMAVLLPSISYALVPKITLAPKEFLKLQQEEIALTNKRLKETKDALLSLESRKSILNQRIVEMNQGIQKKWIEYYRLQEPAEYNLSAMKTESERSARRFLEKKILESLILEMQAYGIDLADAEQIEKKIQSEKFMLEALQTNLEQTQTVIALQQQLQVLRKKQEVAALVKEWNSRVDLAQSTSRYSVSPDSAFFRKRGSLELPVSGKILHKFGKYFDPEAKVSLFKKGVEIESKGSGAVKAIFDGKVVFQGTVPQYGNTLIIDHGDHFYSVLGQLGSAQKKSGDKVRTGEVVAASDEKAGKVYFEIRAKNIPVNPLQWISSVSNLN